MKKLKEIYNEYCYFQEGLADWINHINQANSLMDLYIREKLTKIFIKHSNMPKVIKFLASYKVLNTVFHKENRLKPQRYK